MEDTDKLRKKLLFQSSHRGTKELDYLLGTFAKDKIQDFSSRELQLYEEFLKNEEPEIFSYICGNKELPAKYRSLGIEDYFGKTQP